MRLVEARSITAIAGTVILAATVTACGADRSSPPPSTHSTGAPTTSAVNTPSVSAAMITITNYAYTVPGSVKAGAKVTVTNTDQIAHTVTADSDGGFDVTIQGGATASFTAPSKPGSYKFHCTFHSNMHGTLVVS